MTTKTGQRATSRSDIQRIKQIKQALLDGRACIYYETATQEALRQLGYTAERVNLLAERVNELIRCTSEAIRQLHQDEFGDIDVPMNGSTFNFGLRKDDWLLKISAYGTIITDLSDKLVFGDGFLATKENPWHSLRTLEELVRRLERLWWNIRWWQFVAKFRR